ncbi:MAG: nucleotidyltransferase domain-containing protein [Pyrinomonadaceae bacterium]
MIEEIKNELSRIQDRSDIKILLAVESGSRAWGFESTDSDWDVRYVYVHSVDWYLRIDRYKDSQEEILPNDIDLSGWELRKALGLFRKSNPPLLEWLRSPIVYLEQFSTAAEMRDLSEKYFNPKSCMYHYLSMAKGNFNEFLKDRDLVKSKKYFYVLRPILACDWIEMRNSFPPMEFQKLVDAQVTNTQLKEEIERLLARKMAGEELREEEPIKLLNDFLAERIGVHSEHVGEIDTVDRPQTEMLDQLFRSTLKEVWN